MKIYLDLLKKIKDEWITRMDRTWTGTRSLFWEQLRFNLGEWFPLITTKKMFTRWIIHELLWFLSWDTNIKYLIDNNVHIWDEWPYTVYSKSKEFRWETQQEFIEKIKNLSSDDLFVVKWCELWPVYWKQWRRWETKTWEEIDQISFVLDQIKNNPYSRRMLVSWWNVGEIQWLIKSKFSAPPLCHSLFQFYVANGKLSCKLYQRSADYFLWVPFNIASYSLLTMMIAQVCDLEPWDFIHTFWDVHLYNNHLEQTNLQLSRTPKKLPKMRLNPEVKNLFDFKIWDFELDGYECDWAIKAPIAI
jgi:thymidylate synthase